jgi:hypothetical protein
MPIRKLSVPDQSGQRRIMLGLWFVILGAINAGIWTGYLRDPLGGPASATALISSLLIWLVPPLLVIALMPPGKTVSMSEDGLLISDGKDEILVPFAEIAGVTRAPFEPNAYIEVAFRSDTRFGDRIRFVPRPARGFLPWLDPAVKEFLKRVGGR